MAQLLMAARCIGSLFLHLSLGEYEYAEDIEWNEQNGLALCSICIQSFSEGRPFMVCCVYKCVSVNVCVYVFLCE